MTRKPYSLHKYGTENLALLIGSSNVTEESDISSHVNRMYMVRVPQHFETSLEDLQMKSHVTSTRLLPWSRVYRMTHSTEAIPGSHQPKVYGSYDSGNVHAEPRNSSAASQHFMVRCDLFAVTLSPKSVAILFIWSWEGKTARIGRFSLRLGIEDNPYRGGGGETDSPEIRIFSEHFMRLNLYVNVRCFGSNLLQHQAYALLCRYFAPCKAL